MPFAALALFGCVLYFPMPQRKVSRQDFAVEIEAVRMVDAAVKTVTDTPLDSLLLGQQSEGSSSDPAGTSVSSTSVPADSMAVCTPVPFAPPPREVVSTPQQLRMGTKLLSMSTRLSSTC